MPGDPILAALDEVQGSAQPDPILAALDSVQASAEAPADSRSMFSRAFDAAFEESQRLKREQGQEARAELERFIASANYSRLSDDAKATALRRRIGAARRRANDRFRRQVRQERGRSRGPNALSVPVREGVQQGELRTVPPTPGREDFYRGLAFTRREVAAFAEAEGVSVPAAEQYVREHGGTVR